MKLTLTSLFILSTMLAHASQVTTRTQLRSILGGIGTIDDFEPSNVAANTSLLYNGLLTSSSVLSNGASNIVHPVSTYVGIYYAELLVNGPTFGGLSTCTLSPGRNFPMEFDISTPVMALGFDAMAFANKTYDFDVIFSRGSTTLGTISMSSTNASKVFFGWADPLGIDSVWIGDSNQNLYQNPTSAIDDMEWGVVPDPATSVVFLGAIGTLLKRRQRLK